jgi:hypothetical protein
MVLFSNLQGAGAVIGFAMVCRGLASSKNNNAGAVVGIYAMFGSTGVLIISGLGGALFGIHEIYPFIFYALPVLVLSTILTVGNFIFY